MTQTEWLATLNEHWDDLKVLVLQYHPRARYRPKKLPITAPGAEIVCEAARRQIATEGAPVTEELLQRLKDSGNSDKLYSLLYDAWFGVPESTECWQIPGFDTLCTLLDGSEPD